ncbi:MAG: hypothetical protein ACOYWZ_09065 [Bacillota bacterium]
MDDSRFAGAGAGFFGGNFIWIILLLIIILPLFGFGGFGGFASEDKL